MNHTLTLIRNLLLYGVPSRKSARLRQGYGRAMEVGPPSPRLRTGRGSRNFLLLVLLLASSLSLGAQIRTPVKWSTGFTKVGASTFDLQFTAKIDQGWYVYSQFIEDGGPIPTSFNFQKGAHFELVGKTKENSSHRKEVHDNIFDMQVIKFAQEVTFVQRVKVLKAGAAITGYLEYMTCDDNECLPPTEEDFSFNLPAGTESSAVAPATDKGGAVAASPAEEAEGPAVAQEEAVTAPVPEAADTAQVPVAVPKDALYGDVFPKPDLENPVGQCGESVTVKSDSSYWSIFVLGFLGGLLALLTPCVFPMIPLTVSFFTKSSGTRRKGITNATMYGLFILLVYVILSIPFHLMDSINPDILNDISTNVWLNVAFFVIFLIFAFSFFGYYELTLPSSWANKAAAAEGIGGVIGIFFMAMTLALVSFSCTGPILGSLLAGALTADGGAWQLTAGMSGFGLALALPFALFAAFPSWMSSLPKSGGWLNTVKVTLGFLELALALKFLSNADLVKHWGVLKIELFLGLWILIFLGLALYLLGRIRFPHDSPVVKLSRGRLALGLLSLGFTVYLMSGFFYDQQAGSYRPLKLLSGLAPPAGYSFFYPSDCPQNLNCFKDLSEGLAYARKTNKPVMLDFTGYACVNCRKMEEHVWPEQSVYGKLKDDFVLISLYVDDKRELPADQQLTVTRVDGGQRKLRTYGQKWAHLQTEFFQANSQPFYVLISADGQLLNSPTGYTPDPQEYAQFLECGKEAFKYLTENKLNGKDRKEMGMLGR